MAVVCAVMMLLLVKNGDALNFVAYGDTRDNPADTTASAARAEEEVQPEPKRLM